MINIEFKDGRKYLVGKVKLTEFLLEHGIPYNEYLEYIVRKKLGQDLDTYTDFKNYKNSEVYGDCNNKPEHLRFHYYGQDKNDDSGVKENAEILNLFGLPITAKSSYSYMISHGDVNEYKNIFIIHKGSPILFEKLSNGALKEVADFTGYGTVEMIINLLTMFKIDVLKSETIKVGF